MKVKKHLLLQLADQNEIIEILSQLLLLERELKVTHDELVKRDITNKIIQLEQRLEFMNR